MSRLLCRFSCLLVAWLFVAQLISTYSMVMADELIIVRIVVNKEEKGDFFVTMKDDGDFLLTLEDWKKLGFELESPQMVGKEALSLRDMVGASYNFDIATLSLEIIAEPALLGREIIDFSERRSEQVYQPNDTSFFLNYGVDYLAGNDFNFSSFTLTAEAGLRKDGLLFLTNGVYTLDQSEENFTRLQSHFTYDDRESLRRLIFGDFFATSGDLGSSLNLGGISLRKIYRMNPDYVYYPTLNFAGQTSLPTEAKIYLNDMLIRTEQLSPGEFELKNLTTSSTAGNLEVVLIDAFGREERLRYPFYYADKALLKEGFQEYNYNLGFIREDYGERSFDYGDPAFSAFHRYGVNDDLTLGMFAEASSDHFNLGTELTFLAGRAGILSLSLAGSTESDAGSGTAGLATYSYQRRHFGLNFSLAGYSQNYRTASDSETTDRPQFSASAGLSFGTSDLGTLSLDLTSVRRYSKDDRDQGNLSYSRSITPQLSFTSTYRKIWEEDDRDEFFLTLNYTPKSEIFTSSRYEQREDQREVTVSIQKNPPIGEGFSYRADIKRTETAGEESWMINPYLRYNGRYGIYEAGFEERITEKRRESQYQLSAAGALVSVGGAFGATRPVYDSFGLVDVGDIDGVKVKLNSREVGVTNGSGQLFIPNMSSYAENQVEIDPANIPMDYYISGVKKKVSPPLRSGSCISFAARKMQPVFGRLAMRVEGELKPLEFLEVTCTIDGREFTFPTGSGGEFDIDPTQSDAFKEIMAADESGCSSGTGDTLLAPGTYQASISHGGEKRIFALTIPESEGPFIDIGQVVVEETN